MPTLSLFHEISKNIFKVLGPDLIVLNTIFGIDDRMIEIKTQMVRSQITVNLFSDAFPLARVSQSVASRLSHVRHGVCGMYGGLLGKKCSVINLSNRQLTIGEQTLLAKGKHFTITPIVIRKEELGLAIYQAKAEELSQESAWILQQAIVPKSNFNKEERNGLRELNKGRSIVGLAANKGNATVVTNSIDYEVKILELLIPTDYKLLKGNPTTRILRETK